MNILPNEITPKWPYFLAKLASAIAIMMGIIDLLGWLFYFWLPEYVSPYFFGITPMASICFILAGMSLWMRCEEKESYKKYLIEICSGIIFLISFLTLFEYAFDINLKINEFLSQEIQYQNNNFNHMSPFSAINFILLSFVLFFLDNKKIGYQVHQIFILILLIITCFELIGHIYQISRLVEIVGFTKKYAL